MMKKIVFLLCLLLPSLSSLQQTFQEFRRRTSLHMKTILVFGGTGKTGSEVVFQALKAGRKVLVLARDPSNMKIPLGSGGSKGGQDFVDSNLKIVKGSVTNFDDVQKCFQVCVMFELTTIAYCIT